MIQVTAGTLITRTFEAWWKNVGKLVVMSLVPLVPVMLVGVGAAIAIPNVVARSAGGEPGAPPVGAIVAIVVVVFLVLVPLMTAQIGGITYGVVQHLAGRPVGVGAMLGQGFRRVVPLALAGFLTALATLGGSLLLIVPGIMIAIATSLALPAVMAERLGPVEAFQRSLALTRGARWHVFGAMAVVFLANMGASLLGNLVAAVVPLLGALVSLAVSLVFAPLPWVVPAVAYHDLRVAREGVDTSALAAVFE